MKLDEYLNINEMKDTQAMDKKMVSGKTYNIKKEYTEEMPDMNKLAGDPEKYFEGDLQSDEFKSLMKEIENWKPEVHDEDDTEEVAGE